MIFFLLLFFLVLEAEVPYVLRYQLDFSAKELILFSENKDDNSHNVKQQDDIFVAYMVKETYEFSLIDYTAFEIEEKIKNISEIFQHKKNYINLTTIILFDDDIAYQRAIDLFCVIRKALVSMGIMESDIMTLIDFSLDTKEVSNSLVMENFFLIKK